MEGDYCGIHHVHKTFTELTGYIETSCNILFPDESKRLKVKYLERKKHALKGLHLAASILDPTIRGTTLLPAEENNACETIYNRPRNMEEVSEDTVLKESTFYRSKENVWSKKFSTW